MKKEHQRKLFVVSFKWKVLPMLSTWLKFAPFPEGENIYFKVSSKFKLASLPV